VTGELKDQAKTLRVLLGPWDKSVEWVGHIAGAEVIPFGPTTALPYDPTRDSLADVLARLPAGWQPDILILWQPHFYAMPAHWEQLGIPTFAVLVDWQLLGLLEGNLDWLNAFDGIFLDRRGVDFLKSQGFENVWQFVPSSFDPAIQQPDPAAPKRYDLSFAGTFRHPIHHRRSQWLYRFARLAERYRIGFFRWTFGPEAYTRLIQQSKIAFNYSYRGELNIRTFETLATGTLLFLEEGNVDAAGFFEDGVHYVSYNAANYQERLEYYLTHDAERQQIAEAGRQQVQRHTNAAHLEWLIRQVRLWRDKPRTVSRAAWSPRQRGLMQFADFYAPLTAERAQAIYAAWDREARAAGDDLAWLEAALAATDYRLNETRPPAEKSFETAARHLTRAIQLAPGRAGALLSLGNLMYSYGELGLAADILQQAIGLLQIAPRQATAVFGPYIPYSYDHFMVSWLETNIRLLQVGGDRLPAWAALLEARAQELLGRTYLQQQKWAPAQAALTRAAELCPENDEVHLLLAQVAEKNGAYATALAACRQSLDAQPIAPEVWLLTAQLLLKLGQVSDCQDCCHEWLTVMKAFPELVESAASPLQAVLAKAEAQAP
jgi:tetratricopeptide (TPR) repeat protein